MIRLSALLGTTSFLMASAQATILLHKDLPVDQRRSLEFDLATLDKISPKDDASTAEAADKMGISGRVAGTALRAWLEERVHYIVPQDWKASRNEPKASLASYPNSGVFPEIEMPTKSPSNEKVVASKKLSTKQDGSAPKKSVTLVMLNIGSGLYMKGKLSNVMLSLKIDGEHSEPILSPRTGIIQIGQGLFEKSSRVEKSSAETEANSIYRLMTFFHEARHSDGNGISLGFLHAVCPEGHSYAGYAACDRSQNGSYRIGAVMAKVLINQCEHCSIAAKEALRADMLDSYDRILKTTPRPNSELEILTLKLQLTLCNIKYSSGKIQSPECASYVDEIKKAEDSAIVPTIDLDPTPETLAR